MQQLNARRIQRVIDHIHCHFSKDIDSAAVAEVAHLSTYHWHRIYVAVTGESAVSTLRRVRLEHAAVALLRDDRPIAGIASECGFENLQSFTRLFSRTYGLPPGKFRATGAHGSTEPPLAIMNDSVGAFSSLSWSTIGERHSDRPMPIRDEQVCAQPVDIGHREPLRLVGLWHRGDYHQIGRVFEKVMAAAQIETWARSEAFTVGVYFNDPDVVPKTVASPSLVFPVHPDFQLPEGYDALDVSGELHATCLHTGPYALLSESYRWLYREWLRDSVHDARDNPCYEVYLNTPYDTPPAELETLICLPLAGIARPDVVSPATSG